MGVGYGFHEARLWNAMTPFFVRSSRTTWDMSLPPVVTGSPLPLVAWREALATAEAAQAMFRAESWPEGAEIRVRMAVHTGEASERDGDYFGPAVNLTARLMATAHGGQVVCSALDGEPGRSERFLAKPR